MTHDFEVVVWGATGYTGRLVSEVLAQNYQVKGGAMPTSSPVDLRCWDIQRGLPAKPLPIARTLQGKVTWAIAGRNDKKLKDLKTELAKLQKGCEVGLALWHPAPPAEHWPQTAQQQPSGPHLAPPLPQELPILVASVDDPASLDALTSRTTVLISTAGPFTATGGPVVEACLRTGTHYCDLAGKTGAFMQCQLRPAALHLARFPAQPPSTAPRPRHPAGAQRSAWPCSASGLPEFHSL